MHFYVFLTLATVFATVNVEGQPQNYECIPGENCIKGDLIDKKIADCCLHWYRYQWTCDTENDGWWDKTVDVAKNDRCEPCHGEYSFICGHPNTNSRCVCDDTATLSFEWSRCRCQYWPHGNPHVIPANNIKPATSIPIPAKNISTTVMPTNSSITTPAANISTTVMPTNSSITTRAVNISTTVMPTNSSITTPAANISTTVMPTNSSVTTPAANISTTVTPMNETTTEPTNFTTTDIPSNSTTTEIPSNSTTEIPSNSTTTEIPSNSTTTKIPSNSTTTEIPSNSTTEYPSNSTTESPMHTTEPSKRRAKNVVEIAVPVVIGIVLLIIAAVIIAFVIVKKPCKTTDYSPL